MPPLLLSACTLTTALGSGRDAHVFALQAGRSGLAPCRFETVALDTWVGEVPGLDAVAFAPGLERFDCRNNRLALATLRADAFERSVARAVARYGASRIGVFVGTSTSGILQTELAYRRRDAEGRLPQDFHYAETHNSFSVADFTRRLLRLEGPAVAVSAACASSAKVFGSAGRMIRAGLIDAAVVGGVDSLCLTTLYGFNSLELISRQACKPFDAERDGISIGEAGGFALLELPGRDVDPRAIVVAGVGESSDAHHMSSPHPEGAGARAAIEAALRMAGIEPGDIGYVNLHGTGTPSNDAAEDKAVHAVFGSRAPASSTKGATGHTLGAAGIVEAIVAAVTVEHGFAPAGLNTRNPDPALRVNYLLRNQEGRIDVALSNSFGFGGANCSLVIGRADRLPAIRVIH
ncbi:MAG: beta-ketoacyl-[acyl-carrier-protein] synthase family protein [Lautropia sp.]